MRQKYNFQRDVVDSPVTTVSRQSRIFDCRHPIIVVSTEYCGRDCRDTGVPTVDRQEQAGKLPEVAHPRTKSGEEPPPPGKFYATTAPFNICDKRGAWQRQVKLVTIGLRGPEKIGILCFKHEDHP